MRNTSNFRFCWFGLLTGRNDKIISRLLCLFDVLSTDCRWGITYLIGNYCIDFEVHCAQSASEYRFVLRQSPSCDVEHQTADWGRESSAPMCLLIAKSITHLKLDLSFIFIACNYLLDAFYMESIPLVSYWKGKKGGVDHGNRFKLRSPWACRIQFSKIDICWRLIHYGKRRLIVRSCKVSKLWHLFLTVKLFVLVWNLAYVMAAVLPRRLPNYKAIGKL